MFKEIYGKLFYYYAVFCTIINSHNKLHVQQNNVKFNEACKIAKNTLVEYNCPYLIG